MGGNYSYQVRCGRPTWAYADERMYIDGLGSFTTPGKLAGRETLLLRYIELIQLRKEPWAKKAHKYALEALQKLKEAKCGKVLPGSDKDGPEVPEPGGRLAGGEDRTPQGGEGGAGPGGSSTV